jgi:hypothetical protein
MTSTTHAFPTSLYRAAIAACLIAAFTVDASAQERCLLADEAAIDEPAQTPPPPTRPSEEQTPQQSDQPKERKRTYDGPPRDELLPIARRLPA